LFKYEEGKPLPFVFVCLVLTPNACTIAVFTTYLYFVVYYAILLMIKFDLFSVDGGIDVIVAFNEIFIFAIQLFF